MRVLELRFCICSTISWPGFLAWNVGLNFRSRVRTVPRKALVALFYVTLRYGNGPRLLQYDVIILCDTLSQQARP